MLDQESTIQKEFEIMGGDFVNGGDASCQIKNILKESKLMLTFCAERKSPQMKLILFMNMAKIRNV